jgi:hypothetical protein
LYLPSGQRLGGKNLLDERNNRQLCGFSGTGKFLNAQGIGDNRRPRFSSPLIAFLLAILGYQNIWTLFGSANQLLAALSLIACAVFLKKPNRCSSCSPSPSPRSSSPTVRLFSAGDFPSRPATHLCDLTSRAWRDGSYSGRTKTDGEKGGVVYGLSKKHLGAFFAEYRKKPGFAGVPSRQEKNPVLCMDFFLGATASRPSNPLRTNRLTLRERIAAALRSHAPLPWRY